LSYCALYIDGDEHGSGLAATKDDKSQSSTAALSENATSAQENQQTSMESDKMGKSDYKRSLADNLVSGI